MSNNPKTENPKEEETKLLGNKKKAENEIELKEEKTNICHLCEKEKSSFLECSNNDFCLLCNEKNNLSNYNEIIKKLPYSQEENNILKTKDKDIKKILENEEKILICSNCIQ